jgi:ubiquinone/menaquinone biosynthesis C-methylase UbiE
MSRTGYANLLTRYRRYAPRYDHKFARYSDGTLARALALVPEREADLLDVACGTGLFIARLRQHRPRIYITGVDISEEMLSQAQRRFAGDAMVRFAASGAERLPVDDASFDIVACNNAFHLVQDADAALREFRRVLRPGGRVIIVDWCIDYPQMAMMAAALRMTDRHARHIRSLRALTALLGEHAFEVTDRQRFRVPPMWGLMAVAATRR